MVYTMFKRSTAFAIVGFLCAGLPAAETYELQLSAGWNAVSFEGDPKQIAFSELVTCIVDSDGQFWSRANHSLDPRKTFPGFPPALGLKIQDGVGGLQLKDLKPGIGYLIFSEPSPEKQDGLGALLTVPLVGSVRVLPEIPKDEWVFTGLPVGSFRSKLESPDRKTQSPPNEAPLFSLLGAKPGEEPVVWHLEKSQKEFTSIESADKKKRLFIWESEWRELRKRTSDDPEWRIKQNHAVWMKSPQKMALTKRATLETDAIEPIKIEMAESLIDPAIGRIGEEELKQFQKDTAGNVVISLGTMNRYSDLKLSRKSEDGIVQFRLIEQDWHFRSGRPSNEEILAFAKLPFTEDAPPAIGTLCSARDAWPKDEKSDADTNYSELPDLHYLNDAAVLPYLESSHGPWSFSRRIRISTNRMTRAQVGEKSEILKAGFYIGRYRLESSDLDSKLPVIVVTFEVPTLTGGYEGLLTAQVLSVRSEKTAVTLERFFRDRIGQAGGDLPFDELVKAAMANSKSIEIGRYPMRLRLISENGGTDALTAQLLKRGTFVINQDAPLTAKLSFSMRDNFQGIPVSLSKSRKTLFLSGNPPVEVETSEVPILGSPNTTEEAEAETFALSRNLQILLQEESAGYLRGVFVEQLSGVLGRATEPDGNNMVTTAPQPIFIFGEVVLTRIASEESERSDLMEERRKELEEEQKLKDSQRPDATSATTSLMLWRTLLSGRGWTSLVTTLLPTEPAAPLPATVQIRGKVVDQDGVPIGFATAVVCATNNQVVSVRCDKEGEFLAEVNASVGHQVFLMANHFGFDRVVGSEKPYVVQNIASEPLTLTLERPVPGSPVIKAKSSCGVLHAVVLSEQVDSKFTWVVKVAQSDSQQNTVWEKLYEIETHTPYLTHRLEHAELSEGRSIRVRLEASSKLNPKHKGTIDKLESELVLSVSERFLSFGAVSE